MQLSWWVAVVAASSLELAGTASSLQLAGTMSWLQLAGTMSWLQLTGAAGSAAAGKARDTPTTPEPRHLTPEMFNSVKTWSYKLGTELWNFGEYITRRKDVQNSFKSAQVVPQDGAELVRSMAHDIRAMMELKVSAVRRVVEAAENVALSKQHETVPSDFKYYNSKDMKEPERVEPSTTTQAPGGGGDYVEDTQLCRSRCSLNAHLEPNPFFSYIPVNTSFSSVHIPTNVYDWAPEVIRGIHWSEHLDSIFINNYKSDPTLSWQYFGSSTGFMRHYPALKWRADPVDIYDCRTRAWYMEAAASPKDVVILVDRSGSMTGQRRDIAKHVVTNILDTLGNNDFVSVLTFADTVEEVVPCFEDSLVQATLANLREIKLSLDNFDTMEIANFSAALIKAFDLLERYRNYTGGASCNQAIYLVTDGVPYNYKEIFEMYNWAHEIPVRVFTYLIGREVKVADVREVKWMACANRGFYVHLSTLAEVRERVLEHVNVLSRPLVLQRNEHPAVWTPVYANVTDPKVADYLWDQLERAEQKERFMSSRKQIYTNEERWLTTQMKHGHYSEIGDSKYQLMTSVSMPVYDLRHNENITENIQINEASWVSVTRESVQDPAPREVRIAHLLGVAGTDVPLQEIQALMTPYKIGVNGYAFIVTNNGYILLHPDLRPVFQGILKPSYNSVDMIEVELFDDDRGPRNFSKELAAFRKEIVDQTIGDKVMNVKYHMDGMKRAVRSKRHYFWKGIEGSPFTLVVAIPEGRSHKLAPPPDKDIHRHALTKGTSAAECLTHHWSIHPDWLYCRHYDQTFESSEEQLIYFLDRMTKPGWKWPLKPKPPEQQDKSSNASSERERYYCDNGLIQALVYHARNTDWFNNAISNSTSDNKRKEFLDRFGLTTAFLSTYSGLTRWQTFPAPVDVEPAKEEFGKVHPRSIDEVWYRRAVDFHYLEPNAYVYSVSAPSGGNWSEAAVTAAHAVFHGEGHKRAPAAVVGFQFAHNRLRDRFNNITSCDGAECVGCNAESVDCYLVDDNGWVVLSNDSADTGRFFGKIRPDIMSTMIQEEIFRVVHLVDYQAVCFREKVNNSPASAIFTPLEHLKKIAVWLISTTLWWYNSVLFSLTEASTHLMDDEYYTSTASYTYDTEESNDEMYDASAPEPTSKAKELEFKKLVVIRRSKPSPCDRQVALYHLEHSHLEDKLQKTYGGCSRPFIAQLVKYTNLLMVVADRLCPPPAQEVTVPDVDPVEVLYNETLPCLKHAQPFYRTRPKSCINKHEEESTIDMCGQGSKLTSPYMLILITLVIKQFV